MIDSIDGISKGCDHNWTLSPVDERRLTSDEWHDLKQCAMARARRERAAAIYALLSGMFRRPKRTEIKDRKDIITTKSVYTPSSSDGSPLSKTARRRECWT
jgi:hypothetical protein